MIDDSYITPPDMFTFITFCFTTFFKEYLIKIIEPHRLHPDPVLVNIEMKNGYKNTSK